MRLYSGGGKRLPEKRRAAPAHRGGKRLAPSRHKTALLAPVALLAAGGVTLSAWLMTEGKLPGGFWPEEATDITEITGLAETPRDTEQAPSDPGGTVPENVPEDDRFILSFAGDCTLGAEHTAWSKTGNFPDVVGSDYAYPFSGVREILAQDDFTFVNLECALTDHNVPADKTYRFRGLPEYGEILTAGSVEAVTLANNHSQDYGAAGLKETRQVLESLGISAGGDGETFLYTTERGLRVGVYTAYHIGRQGIRQAISSLQEQGAEVIVAAFHAGTEGSYQPTDFQRQMFRYAAECGAQIVYNSHPHVLQPMEYWGESVIFYSLGNFCFGGNRNPTDKDTAILQVTVERQEDGTVTLAQVDALACSVTSTSGRNDYRPCLYAPDSAGAKRVEQKLDGTYRPKTAAPATPDAAAGEQTAKAENLAASMT